jgi:hypothetical protein
MEFIARWFTPSKSDQQSGEQYNTAYNAAQQAQAAREQRMVNRSGPAEKQRVKKIAPPTRTKYGGDLLGAQADIAKKTLLGQ